MVGKYKVITLIVSPLGLRSSICGTQPFGSSDGSEGLVYLKKSQNGS